LTAPTASAPRVVLGLLGGIASGKSTVARLVAERGPGHVVDADALAREALDACARDGRLVSCLGPWAVKKDGTPDRKAIAKRVFSDPPLLRALERLTHPAVLARIGDAVEDHRAGKGPRVLVLDVPLLIEAGVERRCDELWFVEAPDDLRFARAAAGALKLSQEEVVKREVAQSPLDRKKARADRVIHNTGDEKALAAEVDAALRGLGITRATC
jgi:dephospho-CoA kinase